MDQTSTSTSTAPAVATSLVVGVVGLASGALALMASLTFAALTEVQFNRLSFLCYGVPAILVGLAVGAMVGMVLAAPLQRLTPAKAKMVLAGIAAIPVLGCCTVAGLVLAAGAATSIGSAAAAATDDGTRDRLLGLLWVADTGHAIVFYSDGTYGGGIADREGRRYILMPDTHSWRIEGGALCMMTLDMAWQCDRTTVEANRVGLTECRAPGDCVTMYFAATDVDGWECSGEWCGSFAAQRLRAR
jgi:hypothetical protein